ncbi:monofunctional biosynthetic peptidoglycan transglycosylase [Jannaschia sp. W003]|uniref:monofunctional biosynthetic peptidoglycan transglycosylase n=1 Tax=Jannaschia sp. W003 TaxID=2867012 RepID=UPI0021A62C01|nr:monofunctional biosynthetic peptidoglycan transglycosylase [Jannaschia sp. W003]UWQ22045.1 monofunctional biosynthetic peptidoglycan transglycosylase [Jannaschia sp. W003]
MATKAKKRAPRARGGVRAGVARLRRWAVRLVLGAAALVLLWVLAYRWIDPPTTPHAVSEGLRLGRLERTWVDMEQIAPVMARAAVAAEDANFCRHWGFDVDAIRDAIEDGGGRGASTISQQVVKNAFLWQGRSWPRKALETALTPVMEAMWPKRRILEVYLNIAEMGVGVFGVEAAARHHFGKAARDLSAREAARLAAILPSPRTRDPAAPTPASRRRAVMIEDGAATIRADGRAACFED